MAGWESYRDKRVLVTGAQGFIGSHLVAALAQAGSHVIACAASGQSASAGPGEHVTLDVTDKDAVRKTIAAMHPQVIFHLAAKLGGTTGPQAYSLHMQCTFAGTINVAEAALDEGARLVQLGSSEEYGDGPVPFSERQATRPLSPYSAAKAAATDYLVSMHKSDGLDVVILRPTVIYGPGQKSSMLIPTLFHAFMKGVEPELTPGEQTRDFVFVEDLIEAIVAAGALDLVSGEIINVASGKELLVKDVARQVADICQYTGGLGLGKKPYRRCEIMRHRGSCARAMSLLHWQPRVDFAQGLLLTHRSAEAADR